MENVKKYAYVERQGDAKDIRIRKSLPHSGKQDARKGDACHPARCVTARCGTARRTSRNLVAPEPALALVLLEDEDVVALLDVSLGPVVARVKEDALAARRVEFEVDAACEAQMSPCDARCTLHPLLVPVPLQASVQERPLVRGACCVDARVEGYVSHVIPVHVRPPLLREPLARYGEEARVVPSGEARPAVRRPDLKDARDDHLTQNEDRIESVHPGREGVALEALAQGEPGLHVDVLARKPTAVDLARLARFRL